MRALPHPFTGVASVTVAKRIFTRQQPRRARSTLPRKLHEGHFTSCKVIPYLAWLTSAANRVGSMEPNNCFRRGVTVCFVVNRLKL